MSALVRSLARLVRKSGIIMWRSMWPVTVTIDDGFFARSPEARLCSDGSDLSFDTG